MVAHAFNPSTWEAERGGLQVQGQPQKPSEDFPNLVRPCFQTQNKPCVVVHACHPSIWEAEIGGSRFEDSLSYLVRPSAT